MRWPSSLLIGGVTGLVTAVAGGFAAKAGMEWQKVSSMEGAQGFALAFIFLPLAFLGGLAVGTRLARHGPDVA